MNKYTQYSGSYQGGSSSKKPWLIAIIIGIVVLVVVLVRPFGIGGVTDSDFIQKRDQLLRTEAKKALEYVNKLSDTGGSSSYATLEQVRQYIHGLEVLSELNNSLLGTTLYDATDFTEIYSLISSYTTNLNAGQKVVSNLSELRDAVSAINDKTNEIVDSSTN